MSRLVDPLRLFDAKGRPLSSYEAMESRIKLLEHQLARAMRIIRGQKPRDDAEHGANEHRVLN